MRSPCDTELMRGLLEAWGNRLATQKKAERRSKCATTISATSRATGDYAPTAGRMTINPDAFFEPRLRFAIRKPSAWRYMPPAWSPVAHLKNQNTAVDWIQYAKLPFVTMMGHHESQRHPYPTVNASCRLGFVTPNFDYDSLLRQVSAFMISQHEGTEILERSANERVDGRRATYLKCRYLLIWER